jgi:hypothetical protein
MLRSAAKSIDGLAALLANCQKTAKIGRRWHLCGTFRCRNFEIFQLDRSTTPSIGSRCAIKLAMEMPAGRHDLNLRIGRRRSFALIRQILGDVQVILRNKVLAKRISVHCRDSQFANEFLNFEEYETALENLWATDKRRGIVHMSRGVIVYKTLWRNGYDFIEEMHQALGLICDLHDFIRSGTWRSQQRTALHEGS